MNLLIYIIVLACSYFIASKNFLRIYRKKKFRASEKAYYIFGVILVSVLITTSLGLIENYIVSYFSQENKIWLHLACYIIGLVAGLNIFSHYKSPNEKFTLFVRNILLCATLLILFVVLVIFLMLLVKTTDFLLLVPLCEFITSTDWNPQSGDVTQLGFLPLLWGSVYIMALSIIIAMPMGLLSSLYLSEYCSKKLKHRLKPIIELMSGVPTIVYGYFAAIFVAPMVKEMAFNLGLQASLENALTAGLVIGLMITPYVCALCEDVFEGVPQNLRDASISMGATKYEMIKTVLLPAAKPGVIASLIIAVSRAIGETMIVTMAAGLTANFTLNPLDSMTTITSQIVNLISTDQDFNSPQPLAGFALALVLFLLTFALNILASNFKGQSYSDADKKI